MNDSIKNNKYEISTSKILFDNFKLLYPSDFNLLNECFKNEFAFFHYLIFYICKIKHL